VGDRVGWFSQQVVGMESDEQGIEDPLAGAYDRIGAADVFEQ
jgi:hypothetical protein